MKKISTKELAYLMRDSYKLKLLEEYGVENWYWYGYALNCEDNEEPLSYSDYCELPDEEITAKYEDA